ncbi:hypothetical protein CCH79_00013174 [Gambusia affinis]|uniref:Uncharacterized protein n=1 Tax=Gambusia affinis TaxID=33528 RepID=A0A315WB38_GAMAF|nr:hypothetical protein CCH79_00013174 [Gambusia affinis]
MQWFFVQKQTAAAYSRLHASAAACLTVAAAPLPAPRGRRRHLKRSALGLFAPRRPRGSSSSSDPSSAAEDHRPLGQQETGIEETSAAAVALFQPHGGDVDAEYVRLVVSELAGKAGENPGEELGFLLLLLSMVQIGGAPHRRTEPDSWPVLLACKEGGVSAPMRWVNFRLPHPERLSSSFSSSSSSSSSSPVSAKSMRFIWNNIFSKGSHMLQCLCGRSLKKTKNPTGVLMSAMDFESILKVAERRIKSALGKAEAVLRFATRGSKGYRMEAWGNSCRVTDGGGGDNPQETNTLFRLCEEVFSNLKKVLLNRQTS